MFDILTSWIVARWNERTSWNGMWLVGMGIAVLIGAPFIKMGAYAAIAYGAWQIWKKEPE